MIRLAAVGDVHFDRNSRNRLKPFMEQISRLSDVFLLAGDLTQVGHLEEAKALAYDLSSASIPIVAVLGNHDYHLGQEREIIETLQGVGVCVLEGNSVKIELRGTSVGIAGVKGFGGGFGGACATDFGEPQMKSFLRHTKDCANLLREALHNLDTDYKVALMHYSPISETLIGERKEIYPFLGSYMFAEAIDLGKADIAFHGHAHRGIEKGSTYGGIPVRNVAQPVIQHACNIYTLNKAGIENYESLFPYFIHR